MAMSSARPFPDEPLANPDEDLDDLGRLSASFEEAERRYLDEDDQEQDDSEEGVNEPFDSIEDRSLVFDLHSHLTDSEIADVSLCGTDGKSVVAVRSILAMRSRFFKTLFFGQFRERDMDQVPLGYSSLVLKAVVEYCYTDEIKTAFENLTFEETARSMVGLVAAGNYFSLQGLMSRAYRLTCLMMDEYPALSCAVLDEVSVSGGGHHASELSRVALGIIRLRPESALLPPDTYALGVRSLGAAAMERVMADKEIQTKELTLFLSLKKWAEYVPPSQERDAVLQERRTNARKMASHLDLAKILPSSLCTIVAESGLVPEHLLSNAYCTQALQAERHGITFCQLRCYLDNISTAKSGRILVQGAGLAAVNGTYASCSLFDDRPRYSRRGSLTGFGSGTFVLQTYSLQDGIKKWFLSFEKVKTLMHLYSAPVLSDMDPPPMQKWSSVTVGHEKLRSMQTRKNEVKQKHTSFDSSQHDDDEGLGCPPPICIWLPNDFKCGE
jgi:hypothetical protein